MMRKPDWERQLNEYINANREREFEWGAFDCVRFTLGAVEAITGIDYTEGLAWSNEAEAQAILAEKSLPDRIAEKFEECQPAFAKRGDIGMYEGACGIVIGRYALFLGDEWKGIPITQLERAYHV